MEEIYILLIHYYSMVCISCNVIRSERAMSLKVKVKHFVNVGIWDSLLLDFYIKRMEDELLWQ